MKRLFALCAMLAIAILGYWAWQGVRAPVNNSSPTVTIAVSLTPLAAPIIIAKKQGFFASHGVNVSLLPVHGGVKSFNTLMAGEADLATVSETVAMFNSFQRDDFNILASFVESNNDVKLWSLTLPIHQSLDVLANARIGVVQSSASEFFLDLMLNLNGLSELPIRKAYYSPDQLPGALLRGEVDAISIWEPYGYQVMQEAQQRVSQFNSKGLHNLSFLLASRSPLNIHQHQRMRQVIAGLNDAIDYIHLHPDESKTVVADYLSMPDNQLAWLWQDYLFRLSLSDALLLSLKNQAMWAREAGLVAGTEPGFRRLLNPGPLTEATHKASLLK
ncbi:ABC transporter substrate-binding protein [Salinivibrio sp. DV]|uniref:ABC transporter substrate-binding protein n=1 Tax=Salinivibrio sp. SS2 TaxID=1892894 RepID=UPI000A016F49|nr:ABC transporter substrate-binding protein [Salinivibrio sp. DV]